MKKLIAAALAAALAVGLYLSAPAQASLPEVLSPENGGIRVETDCFTLEGALTGYADGSVLDMQGYRLYTERSGDMVFRIQLDNKQRLIARVYEGKVSASLKREKNDAYRLTIHPEYEADDMEPAPWQVKLDAGEGMGYILKGQGAYSDVQAVYPGSQLAVSDSVLGASDGQTGSIFDLAALTEQTACIRCTPEVAVWFDGIYDAQKENLRVDTAIIEEVADFFGDTEIACYDFIGMPRFSDRVTVTIDAGRGSTLYQYNRRTGDLTRMSADYDAHAWSIRTRSPGTYILAEEDGGEDAWQ